MASRDLDVGHPTIPASSDKAGAEATAAAGGGLERFCFVINGLSKDKKEALTTKLKSYGASVLAILQKHKVRKSQRHSFFLSFNLS